MSDHHSGLRAAITRHLQGASWQRCRVHFLRNLLAKVPKNSGAMAAALVRTIFAQPDATHVERQLGEVVTSLEATFPEVANMLGDGKEEVFAFRYFPSAHWRRLWSTNPLERLHAEIKCRTKVVGIYPNDAVVLRFVSAVCLDIHEDWQVDEHRHFSEEPVAALTKGENTALMSPS